MTERAEDDSATSQKPANQQLWSVIEELQDLRNHEDIDPKMEMQIKSAVARIDAARKAVKREANDGE